MTSETQQQELQPTSEGLDGSLTPSLAGGAIGLHRQRPRAADDASTTASTKSDEEIPVIGHVSPIFLEALRQTMRSRRGGDAGAVQGDARPQRPATAPVSRPPDQNNAAFCRPVAPNSQTDVSPVRPVAPPIATGQKRPQVHRNVTRTVAEWAGAGSSATSDLSQTSSIPASAQQAGTGSSATSDSTQTNSTAASTEQGAETGTGLNQSNAARSSDQEVDTPVQQATSISPKKAFMDPQAERMHFLQAVKAVREAASSQGRGGYAAQILPRPQSAKR